MDNLLEIIGPYPPPLGGISIHIMRMEYFFKKENINYKIFNHGRFASKHVIATNKSAFWYLKYLFKNNGSLIHFHQFFAFHFFYYFIFSKINKKKIFITIHSEKIIYSNKYFRQIIFWLLRKTNANALISVSQKLSDLLNDFSVQNICLPATVPPVEINHITLIPVHGKKFFLFSIWKIDRKKSNEIYNIELALRLLSKIKDQYQMLFLIGSRSESDEDYLKEVFIKHNVTDSINIIFEKNLVEYLKNCSFLLRTNNVDGYGVSIQESLSLKIPAIATDVCIRPKGTILFKKNNFEDLYEKVVNLKKYWDESLIENTNYHLQLIDLYKKNLY